MKKEVTVVGAGLAGSEAAYQLSKRGFKVRLVEMKPKKRTPAHNSDDFGELICSNSLKGKSLENACGLLKEEMRTVGSIIMDAADHNEVPAGGCLAVDRNRFSGYITEKLKNDPNITIVEEEMDHLPEGPCIIASGPLTSDALMNPIRDFLDEKYCYFFDAEAPIISADSIDMTKAFKKSRYDNGTADYINCPMDRFEFEDFYMALMAAETVPIREFEKEVYFEGCMPFEIMAKRGKNTLLFGPMKPVGLTINGKRPHAVVQLRQDNVEASLYNIVGFQTHLTWPAQKKIIHMIPGLENAEIIRYGVMHRNNYINAPTCLNATCQCKKRDDLFFAGQMTGVEGYVESAASGMLAGINMAHFLNGEDMVVLSNDTVLGALQNYITHADPKNFQPMNANFGIVHLSKEVSKKERKQAYAPQSLAIIKEHVSKNEL